MTQNTPKRILICGLNWSGSGAVFDLLKEYSPAVTPVSGGALDFAAEGGLRLIGEFEMFRAPGFIGDKILGLDSYFVPRQAQASIRRQLLSFRFKAMLVMRKARRPKEVWEAGRVYRQVVKTKRSLVSLFDRMDVTADKQERMKLSQAWLEEVVDNVSARRGKCILLDQAIHLGQHQEVWPEFFSPYKLIVVHRNPLDIFAEQEKHRYLFRQQVQSNEISMYGDSFDDAIRYRADVMRARMRQVDRVAEQIPNENVLVLRFEDLVKNYDRKNEAIRVFLDLEQSDHSNPRLFFDPDKSIQNVGIAKRSNISIPPNILAPLMQWYQEH